MTEQQNEGLREVLALIESARRSIATAKDGVQVDRLLAAAELSLFVAVSEVRTILEPLSNASVFEAVEPPRDTREA